MIYLFKKEFIGKTILDKLSQLFLIISAIYVFTLGGEWPYLTGAMIGIAIGWNTFTDSNEPPKRRIKNVKKIPLFVRLSFLARNAMF